MNPTTYRSGFYDAFNPLMSSGPATYTTNATPIEYRGFTIYERIPWNSKTKYGEIDAVIGGMVVMMTCTVQGAKERINDLIAGGEERAREKLVKAGIPIPEPEPTTLF